MKTIIKLASKYGVSLNRAYFSKDTNTSSLVRYTNKLSDAELKNTVKVCSTTQLYTCYPPNKTNLFRQYPIKVASEEIEQTLKDNQLINACQNIRVLGVIKLSSSLNMKINEG